MKKFFSLIGLVGVFAACQPENLSTAFSLPNAKVTIKANVTSGAEGFNGVADEYLWTGNGTGAGETFTMTNNSAGGVDKSTVDVRATFHKGFGDGHVDVPAARPGAVAEYNVYVTIPFIRDGYEFKHVKVSETVTPKHQLLGASLHGHAFDGLYSFEDLDIEIPMLENANDYILVDSYSYDTYTGLELVSSTLNTKLYDEADLGIDFPGIKETPKKVEFKVSAWALYNVVNVITETETTYNVVATPLDPALPNLGVNGDGIVAVYTVLMKDSATQLYETAHPNHASHYQHGHGNGHGHGENSNAGGGLWDAE